jgi:phenylacetic acid degradation operon negative regulatory protein
VPDQHLFSRPRNGFGTDGRGVPVQAPGVVPERSPGPDHRRPADTPRTRAHRDRLGRVRARSALFDVYGGHLRERGGAATIAALVRLLEPLGFAAPAVRTAVSRTVRQGWLQPARLPDGPGYAMTPRGERRLDEAAARIYRTRPSTWDGRWHVVVLEEMPGRDSRDHLASAL